LGTLSIQKGVLWWAANHRHHHKFSDQPEDIHSPKLTGFFWSHMGWILGTGHDRTLSELIPDLEKFPELRWLNRHYFVPPTILGALLLAWGGMPALVWGLGVSTVFLWHGVFTINSLSHVFGSRRYETTDTSKNNFFLAFITMGEGWHNNHHCYQSSTRQGFYWWEIDFSYYVLKALSVLGITWDLREPPLEMLKKKEVGNAERLAGAMPPRAPSVSAG
jgi:stearoyl-CoA desaturase (delta-9 desaturase)